MYWRTGAQMYTPPKPPTLRSIVLCEDYVTTLAVLATAVRYGMKIELRCPPYEQTFSDAVSEARRVGAEKLVLIFSDGNWQEIPV